jgi:hypothetical protein
MDRIDPVNFAGISISGFEYRAVTALGNPPGKSMVGCNKAYTVSKYLNTTFAHLEKFASEPAILLYCEIVAAGSKRPPRKVVEQ